MDKMGDSAPPYMPLNTIETQACSSIAMNQENLLPSFTGMTPPVGPKSQPMECYVCKRQILTTVVTKANMKSHGMCLALCLMFSICCCCFIPYCFDSCKSQHHYCPGCNTYLGTFSN